MAQVAARHARRARPVIAGERSAALVVAHARVAFRPADERDAHARPANAGAAFGVARARCELIDATVHGYRTRTRRIADVAAALRVGAAAFAVADAHKRRARDALSILARRVCATPVAAGAAVVDVGGKIRAASATLVGRRLARGSLNRTSRQGDAGGQRSDSDPTSDHVALASTTRASAKLRHVVGRASFRRRTEFFRSSRRDSIRAPGIAELLAVRHETNTGRSRRRMRVRSPGARRPRPTTAAPDAVPRPRTKETARRLPRCIR